MNKKIAASAVILLLIALSVVLVFIVTPKPRTEFHYQRAYPAGETRFVNIRLDVYDANIKIAFVDDPQLMYSVYVVQYTSEGHHALTYIEGESDIWVTVSDGFSQQTRIKSVDVVLGTGTYYDIRLDCTNVTTSVIFDNGAILAGQTFLMASRPGYLYFELTENVTFSEMGLKVMGNEEDFDFDVVVDLPDGLNGRLQIDTDMTLNTFSVAGWSSIGTNTWGTPSVDEPLLDINIWGSGNGSFNVTD